MPPRLVIVVVRTFLESESRGSHPQGSEEALLHQGLPALPGDLLRHGPRDHVSEVGVAKFADGTDRRHFEFLPQDSITVLNDMMPQMIPIAVGSVADDSARHGDELTQTYGVIVPVYFAEQLGKNVGNRSLPAVIECSVRDQGCQHCRRHGFGIGIDANRVVDGKLSRRTFPADSRNPDGLDSFHVDDRGEKSGRFALFERTGQVFGNGRVRLQHAVRLPKSAGGQIAQVCGRAPQQAHDMNRAIGGDEELPLVVPVPEAPGQDLLVA